MEPSRAEAPSRGPLAFLRGELDSIRQAGLHRRLRRIDNEAGPEIVIGGRPCVHLCSNGYLGLACDPRVREAAAGAARQWGAGAGASRLVSGNLALHERLEVRLAAFKGTEAALLFNSGYHANLGTISALVGPGDVILSDALNHASIIDACRLSRARTVVYPHLDLAALGSALSSVVGEVRRTLVVTEGVFSMDGDIAPLPDICALSRRHGAILMVDDAHGTAVMGVRGRGTLEHFGMPPDAVDVQMGTLGKALGSFGAFVAGRADLVDYLLNRARSFVFTTALPPAAVGAALAALEIVEGEPDRIERLRSNARCLRDSLAALGYTIGAGDGPARAAHVIPVLVGEARAAMRLSEALLERGVFAQGIRPPSVPEGGARIRVTAMATHTREQIERAVQAFALCRGLVP